MLRSILASIIGGLHPRDVFPLLFRAMKYKLLNYPNNTIHLRWHSQGRTKLINKKRWTSLKISPEPFCLFLFFRPRNNVNILHMKVQCDFQTPLKQLGSSTATKMAKTKPNGPNFKPEHSWATV